MARSDTIEALKRRGISKKTATALADAGFTIESLKSATPERVGKFISAKEAKKVLSKAGQPEAPPKKKEPKARAAPAETEPAEPEAAEPEAPEPPPKTPDKVPKVSDQEGEIQKILKDLGRTLPRQIAWDLVEKTKGIKISKKQLAEVVRRVCDRYNAHLIDPNESAGIVSAQSIGEPGTQMSLHSEERIIVRRDGHVLSAPIGAFVDVLMAERGATREGLTEWCDIPQSAGIEVPSLNDEGKLIWKPVRAVSRHQHQRRLIRLVTRTGREVTATANHSFVTRRNGRIVPVLGEGLQRGDRIPVMRCFPSAPWIEQIELRDILPRDRYWHGSELARARALGPRWREGYGRDFIVPVAPNALGRRLRGSGTFDIEDGFVYPFGTHSLTRIPEQMPLDGSLGWLMGAYLSEGWASRYIVNISNTEENFLVRTRKAASRFGVRYAGFVNDRGFARGYDLHLRSSVLSDLLRATCGSGSAFKRLPDFAFAASDAFASALLRGYFEGDGNVTVQRGAIRVSSNSEELIDGVGLLLARFGILASKGRTGKQHTLWIPGRQAKAFRTAIGFESRDKRRLLDRLCESNEKAYTYDALDMICGFGSVLWDVSKKLRMPTRDVNSFTRRQRIGRATLSRHIGRFERRAKDLGVDVGRELARLRAYIDEDVFWDEIIEIGETEPPKEAVYDLSVPGLETFTTAQGVVTHNTMRTFHYAGVAEMNVTLGLPRLIEIVDARRVPSTPLMEIHLKAKVAKELDRVRRIAQEIETTKLDDIADIVADMVNMRVMVYPDAPKMKSRGVKADELREKLRKFTYVEDVKRTVDGETKSTDAYVIDSGEPSFKKLQRLVEGVRATKVKGIDNIRRAIIRKQQPEGFVIYTEGSNLAKVLDLEDVDPTKTSTNSVEEIYETLGVEAARNAIIKEAHDTLEEQGLTVDIRHIMLVSDMMTNDGDVKAIGRHGISGRKSSVLARAAFEITAHHLLRAAITGESDALDGVAENVIVGQPVTLGTGAVNLVYKPPSGGARKKVEPVAATEATA